MIWIKFGYLSFLIGWIGSIFIFKLELWKGVVIVIASGIITFLVWLAILQILYFINGEDWIFN